MDKVPSKIITCCILHNICLEVNDGTEIDVANDEDGFLGVPLPGHDINGDGARLRNTIKDTLYRSFNNMNFFIYISPILCL